jgi:hypothetical protein
MHPARGVDDQVDQALTRDQDHSAVPAITVPPAWPPGLPDNRDHAGSR